jgi:hypothetical protein
MFDFKQYYAALLRHGNHAGPRADEALRDYAQMLNRIQAGSIV